MTNHQRTPAHRTELPHLTKTFGHHGVIVSVRCYAVAGRRGQRFEVLLWGNGSHAVVDVPGWARDQLSDRISAASEAFADAVLLRLQAVKR